MGNRVLVPSVVPGGMTLISTTSLSGTSTSLTSIPTTYKELKLVVINASINSGTTYYGVRLNGDTGAGKHLSGYQGQYDGAANVAEESDTSFLMTWASSNTDSAYFQLFLPRYTDTAANQFVVADGFTTVAASQQFSNTLTGLYKKSAAITQIDIITRNGTSTFDGGTVYLYGVS